MNLKQAMLTSAPKVIIAERNSYLKYALSFLEKKHRKRIVETPECSRSAKELLILLEKIKYSKNPVTIITTNSYLVLKKLYSMSREAEIFAIDSINSNQRTQALAQLELVQIKTLINVSSGKITQSMPDQIITPYFVRLEQNLDLRLCQRVELSGV